MTGPRSAIDGFITAWNRHNADELASLFADDATFVNVTGLWWTDREKIRDAHAYGFEKIFSCSTARVGRIEIRQMRPDLAVVTARMHIIGQVDPSGNAVDPRNTVMTMVVEKHGENWVVLSAQNTDVPPGGMETHINTGSQASPTRYRE